MQSLLHLRPVTRSLQSARTFLTSAARFEDKGRGPEEHVTNQTHKYNIQAEASNKGQEARKDDAKDTGAKDNTQKQSGATSEMSTSTAKEAEAKSGRKDRGMGLQDERGGKGDTV